MSIFNSLGSNYNYKFIKKNLFGQSDIQDFGRLEKYLNEKYGGKTFLTYKGREALRIALKIINKPDEYTVGICGFTCFAVYEAITREGYEADFLDIEKDNLNFSVSTLKSAVKKNPSLKIVFIQNTLGYPSEIEKIAQFCKDNSIILVEDLAHSIGAKYKNGKEAGTVGDFTMLSFSQDKVIDGVSGGALIVRNSTFIKSVENFTQKYQMNETQQLKDKLYPVSTLLIRKMYSIKVGKLLHLLLKKANFLSNPMLYEGSEYIHELPEAYAQTIFNQYTRLAESLMHRKKIAKVYNDILDKNLISQKISEDISLSTNLRFPIFVNNRKELIGYLKTHNIYVSDIWYDAPVAPKKYLNKTNYKKGDCPNAENIAEKIVNLPTHKNISEQDAKFIAEKINLWLKSQ